MHQERSESERVREGGGREAEAPSGERYVSPGGSILSSEYGKFPVSGIPEFGIPPCEPLIIPEIVINQGKGPVTVQSRYTNIHVTGASQFVIKSIK